MKWFATLLCLLPLSFARAEAPSVKAVLAQFAQIEALSASFHEEKTMALLATPISSDGKLYYQKPRMLVRQIEKPHRGTVLLKGTKLSFGDAKHSQSMDIDSQPALRVLVDTFVSVLAGDQTALEKVAVLALDVPPQGGYRIRVTPKDDKVKRLVRTMTFEGNGANLTRMELLDANGDTTRTTFTEVEQRKPFSEAEQKKLFRIGG